MQHTDALPFLREALLFLALAGLLMPLLQRLHINQVLGFLAAGVIVGPYGLGLWAGDHSWLRYLVFQRPEGIAPLAELGVLFLMFMIGLELSAARLLSMRAWVFGAGTAQVLACAALIGGGLGFLWYNAPPAAVFMGDTGSLALGGALGAIAVATKHEVVLAIVGGLFVVEALSVIIQVLVYKRTGKRVFLMAPIHHHFEKKGWAEPQIVIRFWIIALVLALIGLSTLKLR